MYSLKGYKLSKDVSQKGRGLDDTFINKKLEELYSLTNRQQDMMHDMHLYCKTSQLYDNVAKTGLTPTKKNNQFVIPIPTDPRFSSKAIVSPNGRLDLYVGCSQNPLLCTHDGFSDLTEYIGTVKNYLESLSNSHFISSPARDWIFVYYHFNRDSEPIIDSQYRFSLGQHSKYFYVKEFDNGQVKYRNEEKRVPNRSLKEEQSDILKSQELFPQ